MNESSSTPSGRDRNAIGIFVSGLVIGGLLVFGISLLRGAQLTDSTALRAVIRDELSALNLKELAKQGALEAIHEDQQRAQAESPAESDSTFVGPQQPSPTAPAQTGDVQVPLGNNILGEKNAPVVMIEYSDFQ